MYSAIDVLKCLPSKASLFCVTWKSVPKCQWLTKMYYFHRNTVSSLLGFLRIVDVCVILHVLLHFYALLQWRGEPWKKGMPQPGSVIIHIHTLPRINCSLLILFPLKQGQSNECLIAVVKTLFLISELTKSYRACHLIFCFWFKFRFLANYVPKLFQKKKIP